MNNSKLPIICFHGSPGVPEEFKKVGKFLPSHRFITFARNGYPQNIPDVNFSENTALTSDALVLGYSWGNVPALQYAYKNAKHVKGIIMVSPYLFPSKKSRMKLLFSIPLASNIIFRFLGNKIITSLLIESSRPQKVPFIYKRLKKILSQPQMISTAVKEKQALDVKILQKIASHDIPILLVWGEKDATINEDEQIDPMRRWIKNLKEIRLKNVGHALPFTSPKSLADSINTFIKEKRL